MEFRKTVGAALYKGRMNGVSVTQPGQSSISNATLHAESSWIGILRQLL